MYERKRPPKPLLTTEPTEYAGFIAELLGDGGMDSTSHTGTSEEPGIEPHFRLHPRERDS